MTALSWNVITIRRTLSEEGLPVGLGISRTTGGSQPPTGTAARFSFEVKQRRETQARTGHNQRKVLEANMSPEMMLREKGGGIAGETSTRFGLARKGVWLLMTGAAREHQVRMQMKDEGSSNM